MKHIVHVSNDFSPLSGGINTHLQNLLSELGKIGFKITLLVPIESSIIETNIFIDDSWSNFTCVRVQYPRTRNLFLKLYNLTKATKAGLQWIEEKMGIINLIHQHDNRATRIGATIFARKNSIPIIWTNHSSGFFQKSDIFARMLTYIPGIRPDGVIVVHHILLDQVKSFFESCPVDYIPNGVNINQFQSKKIDSKNEKIILFPQRMVALKGVEQFAQAVKILLKSEKVLNLNFWFAGSQDVSNSDSTLINKVKKSLLSEEKKGIVQFLGNLSYDQMPTYYRQADIVVLPLQIESESISVFETWATGTALITTKQVEKNGYVIHNENCLIVPKKDPKKLAEAVIQLANDENLRKRLGMNGRKLVEKKFKWIHTAEKTSDFYHQFLSVRDK